MPSVKVVTEPLIFWLTEPESMLETDKFSSVGSSVSQLKNIPGDKQTSKTQDKSPEKSENIQSITKKRRSIESPIYQETDDYSSPNNDLDGSSYLEGLKGKLGQGQIGSSGYKLDDDGGNISVIKSVLPNPKISDYGLIRLQFKIKNDGSVDAESVIPVILGDPVYTDASIKALIQWRFSIRRHKIDNTYRISFIFKPE